MRTLSPKISFRNKLIHDTAGLIKYRNKLELYEKFKSDDLKIWASNHLAVEAVNSDDTIEGFYQFISMLDNNVSYTSEKEAFQQLLNKLWSEKHDDFKTVLNLIKEITLDYELFFAELSDGEKSALMNSSLDVFLGFSIIIDQYSREISEQFIRTIHAFLKGGYWGDEDVSSLEIHRADDFTQITELRTKFIITSCKGPLTLENLTPAYEGAESARSFVDVYNKRSEQQVVNRIYAPGAKIDLKDSSAYAEYIEVKYDE